MLKSILCSGQAIGVLLASALLFGAPWVSAQESPGLKTTDNVFQSEISVVLEPGVIEAEGFFDAGREVPPGNLFVIETVTAFVATRSSSGDLVRLRVVMVDSNVTHYLDPGSVRIVSNQRLYTVTEAVQWYAVSDFDSSGLFVIVDRVEPTSSPMTVTFTFSGLLIPVDGEINSGFRHIIHVGNA